MTFAEKLKTKLMKYESQSFEDKVTFDSDSSCWAHTSCPEVEYNLGILGFPIGLTEIAGASKSGKTTLALQGMKNYLLSNKNAVGIMLLSEERLQVEYAVTMGVPIERVFIVKARFVEDLFYKAQIHFNEIEALWIAEKLDGKPEIYVMWDSIGGTNSRAALETFQENVAIYKNNLEKGTKTKLKNAKMADFAVAAKNCMKAIIAQLYEKNIIFVALNHLIANFDTGAKMSTGGGWVEYMPALRLVLSRKEWIKYEIDKLEQEVAQTTIVKVEKNDFGSRRKSEITILLGYGIVLSDADRDYAIEKGILKKDGEKSYSYLNGKIKWNSPRTLFAIYQDDSKRKIIDILSKQITTLRHKDVLSEKITE